MEHLTNHDPFEEVKFISPFISHRLSCEIEHPSTPSLELEPCPSGHQNIVLDSGRDSTLILHDISLETENLCAMDTLISTMCYYEDPNHLLILVIKLFKRIVVDAFVYKKHYKSRSCTMVLTLQLEQNC